MKIKRKIASESRPKTLDSFNRQKEMLNSSTFCNTQRRVSNKWKFFFLFLVSRSRVRMEMMRLSTYSKKSAASNALSFSLSLVLRRVNFVWRVGRRRGFFNRRSASERCFTNCVAKRERERAIERSNTSVCRFSHACMCLAATATQCTKHLHILYTNFTIWCYLKTFYSCSFSRKVVFSSKKLS